VSDAESEHDAICTQTFGNLKNLTKHLRSAHGLQLCKLCVAHKPAFLSEQQRFL